MNEEKSTLPSKSLFLDTVIDCITEQKNDRVLSPNKKR